MSLFYSRVALLATLLFIGSLSLLRAQTPAWQVPVLVPTPANGSSSVAATAADAAGNIYVAGYFSGIASFGSTSLTSAGSSDVFVAKYSPSTNTFLWAVRGGGTGAETLSAISVSGNNVYVGGNLYGASRFGTTALTTAGLADVYVARLTDAGTSAAWVWAIQAGGVGYDYAPALISNGPTLYLAGEFQSQATFGGQLLTSSGGSDGYLARLTDTGTTATYDWVRRLGGAGDDGVDALAVEGTRIYASGFFVGSVAFGSTTLTATGNPDGFVLKLTDATPAPTYNWVQQIRATLYLQGTQVAVNGTAVYVAANYVGSATIGSITLANASAGAVTSADILVARLTDAGTAATVGWAQSGGGPGYDYAFALAVRGANVYMAGSVDRLAAFGPLASDGFGNDVVVARLVDGGSTGRFAWVQRAVGSYTDAASALLLLGPTVYVGGYFRTSALFDYQSVSGAGQYTGFLAGLADPALTAAVPALPAAGLDLFPNPAHNRATVQLPAVPSSPTATLTILDALGRAIRTQTAPTNARAELDLTGLAPGLYAVRVTAGASTITRRLVVE